MAADASALLLESLWYQGVVSLMFHELQNNLAKIYDARNHI